MDMLYNATNIRLSPFSLPRNQKIDTAGQWESEESELEKKMMRG